MSGEPCAAGPVDPPRLDGLVRIQLFLGEGVPDSASDTVAAGLSEWWGAHGLRFEVSPALRRKQRALFDRPLASLPQPVAPAAIYAELRAALDELARPVQRKINVVILDELVTERSAVAQVLRHPAGLSFSPTLLQRATEGTAMDPALLGGDRFTPTVFVAWSMLRARTPHSAALTVAHELGHALGLEHVATPGNLMRQSEPDEVTCNPWLTTEQLARAQRAVGALSR